jgi:hypothetical protein
MSTPADTTALLAKYNDFTASATEITAWNTVATATTDKVVTKAGLFGGDLTKFNEDCVAMAANCKPSDYEAYTGWAIGVNFAPPATGGPAADADYNTVQFKALKQGVKVTWIGHASNKYDVESGALTADPVADTVPATTWADALNPFTAWNAKALASATRVSAQFVFRFQKDDDTNYLEDGDTDDAFAGYVVAGSTFDSVATTGFVFKGAASLTAAAASALVASLLF